MDLETHRLRWLRLLDLMITWWIYCHWQRSIETPKIEIWEAMFKACPVWLFGVGVVLPKNVHQRIGAEYHLPLVCHKSFVFVLVIIIIIIIIINNPTMIHVTHQCNRSVATLRCTAKVAAPTSKSKKPRGSFGPRGAVANANAGETARAWQLGRSATTNGTRGSKFINGVSVGFKWGTRWDVPSW